MYHTGISKGTHHKGPRQAGNKSLISFRAGHGPFYCVFRLVVCSNVSLCRAVHACTCVSWGACLTDLRFCARNHYAQAFADTTGSSRARKQYLFPPRTGPRREPHRLPTRIADSPDGHSRHRRTLCRRIKHRYQMLPLLKGDPRQRRFSHHRGALLARPMRMGSHR